MRNKRIIVLDIIGAWNFRFFEKRKKVLNRKLEDIFKKAKIAHDYIVYGQKNNIMYQQQIQLIQKDIDGLKELERETQKDNYQC